MSYQVVVPGPVQKQLDALPDDARSRVVAKIFTLQENPRPCGSLKLKGYAGEYRVRVGDYRVRYEIRDAEAVIIVLHCGHRKDVYRQRS